MCAEVDFQSKKAIFMDSANDGGDMNLMRIIEIYID